MKALIIITMLISFVSHGSDTLKNTSPEIILSQQGLTQQVLDKRGFKLLKGELTGAGKTIPLHRLEAVILKDRVFFKKQIEAINLYETTPATISSIESVHIEGQNIVTEHISGVLIKNI